MRGDAKSAACSLQTRTREMQSGQLLVESMRIGRLLTRLRGGREIIPAARRASPAVFAALSAKAWLSRLGRGRGSPGSVERPSRILPFRQSILANKAELDLKCPCKSARPRAGTCKKTCHVKCDGLRSVPGEDWYCVDCREPQCGPSCICRTKKRRA